MSQEHLHGAYNDLVRRNEIEQPQGSLVNESHLLNDQGVFSVEVLSQCLDRVYHGATLRALDNPQYNETFASQPGKADAYVINRHGHWMALRKLNMQWWRLDSRLECPVEMYAVNNETIRAWGGERAVGA